jgi:hypothetical protein
MDEQSSEREPSSEQTAIGSDVNAEPLTTDDLTRKLTANAVTILLVADCRDHETPSLVSRLKDVATTFYTGIGFGWINAAIGFSHPSIQPDVLAVTPVLLMFRGCTLLSNDATGSRQIARTLTHENISALFGRTNGGAKLVE